MSVSPSDRSTTTSRDLALSILREALRLCRVAGVSPNEIDTATYHSHPRTIEAGNGIDPDHRSPDLKRIPDQVAKITSKLGSIANFFRIHQYTQTDDGLERIIRIVVRTDPAKADPPRGISAWPLTAEAWLEREGMSVVSRSNDDGYPIVGYATEQVTGELMTLDWVIHVEIIDGNGAELFDFS